MGWLDQIPRAGKLYIGGYYALYEKQNLFKEAGITHVLSILDYDIYEAGHFKEYTHLHVKLDDDPNENILEHFSNTNQFIDSALSDGGAIFVHCAMGKSRSATVVCAYLQWKTHVTPLQALDQVCEGRPVCGPNPGFMEQLHVYHQMLQASSAAESDRIYQHWLQDRYTGSRWSWEHRQKPRL